MNAIENTTRVAPPATSQCKDRNHFVQFYESDEFLVDSVASYIGAGIISGEGAVVIATPDHRRAIAKKLAAQGIGVEDAQARGQYIALDAAETLAEFMVDGCPQP